MSLVETVVFLQEMLELPVTEETAEKWLNADVDWEDQPQVARLKEECHKKFWPMLEQMAY